MCSHTGLRTISILIVSVALTSARCTPSKFPDGGDDAGVDSGPAAVDGGWDAGVDAGQDAGVDAGEDAGEMDAGFDAGETDAGVDAGVDAGETDAGVDAGVDAGETDAGVDAGVDAGTEFVCLDFTEAPPATGYVSNASLGAPCDVSVGTSQANCSEGLECFVMRPSAIAFCTVRNCNLGMDCAPGGGGRCINGWPGFCLATCDASNDCPQNLACNHGVCVPDCRYAPPTYCTIQFGAHTMCNDATGACEETRCETDNDCPNRGFCDLTASPPACIYDCNAIGNFCCQLSPERVCQPSGLCDPAEPYPMGFNLQMPEIDAGPPPTDAGPSDDGGVDAGEVDAGPPPDCSPFDGGPLVDAGALPIGAGLGERCSNPSPFGSPTRQGSCAAGLFCTTISAAGFCTHSCANDNDCATGSALPNRCLISPDGPSACAVICDDTHGCAPGMACQAADTLEGGTLCLPDCRQEWQNFCFDKVMLDTSCDQTTGRCRIMRCPESPCPAGNVCDPDVGVCRVDCRQQPGNFCCSYTYDPYCTASGICVR